MNVDYFQDNRELAEISKFSMFSFFPKLTEALFGSSEYYQMLIYDEYYKNNSGAGQALNLGFTKYIPPGKMSLLFIRLNF